jgi:hypothetical protein
MWIVMAGIHLYRAYSGAMSMGIVTLATSDPVNISKRNWVMRIVLGTAFLGIGISHLVLYATLAHH